MISWEDLGNSIWLTGFLLAVSIALFLFIISIVWLFMETIAGKDRIKRTILSGLAGALPLGFTGVVCGFLSGSSRTPAVSALVPAALTLIGLMVIYLIGKGFLRAMVAGLAVFVFSLNLLTGTILGNTSRVRYEESRESVDFQKAKAIQELAIRLFRTSLGLAPDPPKPPAPSASEK